MRDEMKICCRRGNACRHAFTLRVHASNRTFPYWQDRARKDIQTQRQLYPESAPVFAKDKDSRDSAVDLQYCLRQVGFNWHRKQHCQYCRCSERCDKKREKQEKYIRVNIEKTVQMSVLAMMMFSYISSFATTSSTVCHWPPTTSSFSFTPPIKNSSFVSKYACLICFSYATPMMLPLKEGE